MTLGTYTENKKFLFAVWYSPSQSVRQRLSELKGLIHVASNVDLALEFPDQHEHGFLCSLQSVLNIKEEGFQQKPLSFNQGTWKPVGYFYTGIGRIKSVEPIPKLLSKLPKYPLMHEAIQGLLPTIKDLVQGLIIPCTSSHNAPILPVQEPYGWDW